MLVSISNTESRECLERLRQGDGKFKVQILRKEEEKEEERGKKESRENHHFMAIKKYSYL